MNEINLVLKLQLNVINFNMRNKLHLNVTNKKASILL